MFVCLPFFFGEALRFSLVPQYVKSPKPSSGVFPSPSPQFKELRNLPKGYAPLKAKAKNRPVVPDPKKNVE